MSFPDDIELVRELSMQTRGLGYFNPFKPEFTIVIYIHYKPKIAAEILNL